MKNHAGGTRWALAIAGSMFMPVGNAPAAVWMDGAVALDYYVADVDADGYEYTDADLYVERVVNDGADGRGALSLSGWFTSAPSPAGAGTEIGYLPIPLIPGNSSYGPVSGVAPAEDAAPGEYYAHVLLQDDGFPGSFEDARDLSPRVLWRGGLEAVGPLDIIPFPGGAEVTVDFTELRNNRVDSRVTNDIDLKLYATYGFGPASEGYTLCTMRVAGLYAGDRRNAPGFDCTISAIPDGDYTLHLDVAEAGGRGGYSTLSGPDVRFYGGRMDDGYCCGGVNGEVYVSGALGWTGWPLLLAVLGRGLSQARRRRA